ncbi:hypothetical protein [Actinoplanes palleronii]|uniref:Uncharacterized protein n=1 Tax=Actinoplanes palleronii TaxID=113570 RepID=A0ABQ4BQR5_9ACTN|nr:hypothetical protein [Actinoplanes palleronii]GIE73011.1 hypothetical protein Apa02nite_091190 [Actinoplanes palleronii]
MASTARPELDDSRDSTGAHQLTQPTLDDALAALRRLYGPHCDDLWRTLLARTGLTGQETDLLSFERLVNTMHGAQPIAQMCGRGLAVRAAAYRHLAAANRGK